LALHNDLSLPHLIWSSVPVLLLIRPTRGFFHKKFRLSHMIYLYELVTWTKMWLINKILKYKLNTYVHMYVSTYSYFLSGILPQWDISNAHVKTLYVLFRLAIVLSVFFDCSFSFGHCFVWLGSLLFVYILPTILKMTSDPFDPRNVWR
jgi:hypothetical protein